MNSEAFRQFTCWNPEKVNEVVFGDLGAIPQDVERVVELARVPVPVYRGADPTPRSLEDLLTEFKGSLGQVGENTVIAIVGPSGTGKTLAVKWLHHQLPVSASAHVVYVPRHAVALSAVIELVLSGLEGALFDEVRQEVRKTATTTVPDLQRRDILHEMTKALREIGRLEVRDTQKNLIGTRNEERRVYENGLGDLLDTAVWKQSLLKEGGVIDRRRTMLTGAEGDLTDTQISDAVVFFGVDDLPPVDAEQLRAHPELEAVLSALGVLNRRLAVVDLLNSALAVALPTVGGLQDPAKLFGDVRRALKVQGKELVLLFEDIALAGGVEAHWYNEYRNHQNADLAALRVVFAVTDGHWGERVPEFVKTNATSYTLPNPSGEAGRVIGRELIARYFNLARLGKAGLSSGSEHLDETPNACESCPHRRPCHGEFGDVGGLGLYPLNERTVDLYLKRLESSEQEAGHRGFRPRQVVRELVQHWLEVAYVALHEGVFPGTDREWQGLFGSPQMAAGTLIPEFVDKEAPEAKRVYFTRAYYVGKPEHSTVLAEAFGLPGGTTATCSIAGCDQVPIAGGYCTTHVPSRRICQSAGCENEAGASGHCKFHGTQETAEWVVPSALAWQVGTPGDLATALAEGVVLPLRRLLTKWIGSRTKEILDDRLIAWSANGPMKLRFDEYLKESSFRFADSYGGGVAERDAFDRVFDRSLTSYELIVAALWLERTGSWVSPAVIDGITFELPQWAASRGRWELEEFVESSAGAVADEAERWAQADLTVALRLRLGIGELLGDPPQLPECFAPVSALMATLPHESEMTVLPEEFRQLVEEITNGAPRRAIAELSGTRQGNGAISGIDLIRIGAAAGQHAVLGGQDGSDTTYSTRCAVDLEALLDAYDSTMAATIDELRTQLTGYAAAIAGLDDDRLRWSELVDQVSTSMTELVLAREFRLDVQQAQSVVAAAHGVVEALAVVNSMPHLDELADGDLVRACMALPELDLLPRVIVEFTEFVDSLNRHLELEVERAIGPDLTRVRSELLGVLKQADTALELLGDRHG